LKAFLFSAGGVVAAGGVAYVSGALDPYFNQQPPAQVAALTPSADAAPELAKPGEQAKAPAPDDSAAPEVGTTKPAAPEAGVMKPAAPAGEATAPATPSPAGPVAPTFDVVRVEGDGSLVVAGNAPPNARVDILSGATVIGSTTAGPDGAFAIVLDNPLKPGDYQLALRATAPDSTAVPSGQTALVSVPEKPDGQVLAMVEEPGKPAALMTVPEPVKQPEAPPPVANEPAGAPAEAAPVEAPPVEPPLAEAAAKPEPAAPAAEAAPSGAEPAPPVTAPAPRVVVEAVEIDGDKVFVAGLADPGRKVRAYANEIMLGDATTSPDGHFLVEATHPLAVGTYTVRVDALDGDGARVVARATVPFEREPGEAIAAVAPGEPKAAAPGTAAEQPVEAAATKPADSAGEPVSTEAPAAASQPAEVAAAEPSDAVPETVSPKLEHADGAVIIRRHDTLWHISRRVYGHGIRYTTIYLANQDQIGNPDLIWPGQVFRVPEKSKEGEAANLDALGEQATTAPARTE
jgi:nucleoid-associated protein YgaU